MFEDEDIEKFARKLQSQILAQIKKKYSETVIDHWQNPRNMRKIEKPDSHAQEKGKCGDTMEMFLKEKNSKISECTFQTDGCGTTIVCGSVATELAKNKTLTQALALVNAERILRVLGGLPETDIHCAFLASKTLRRALADLLYNKKASWKKFYRAT